MTKKHIIKSLQSIVFGFQKPSKTKNKKKTKKEKKKKKRKKRKDSQERDSNFIMVNLTAKTKPKKLIAKGKLRYHFSVP